MKAAFLLLALAAAPQVSAAEAGTRTIRLLYASDLDLSSSMDLLEAFEQVVSSDAAHMKIEHIDIVKAYFSQGAFSFTLPEGSTAFAGVPVPAIDAPKEGLFLFATGYSLLERTLAVATRPGGDVPGARLRPARLIPARLPGGVQGYAIAFSTGAPAGWRASLALAYRINIDGKSVTALLVGKPRGGPSRTRALLQRRIGDLREPNMQFSAGFVCMPPEFHAEPDALLKDLRERGNRFVAVSPFDIQYCWEQLQDFGGRTPEKGGLPLLATNLKAGPGAPPVIEPTRVETVGGLRVGFLSLVSPKMQEQLRTIKVPFEVMDPAPAARDAIKDLRGRQKVDLVVAISHLSDEEDARFLDEVNGIDIFLSGHTHFVASSRRETVEIARWNQEGHGYPIIEVRTPALTFNELAISFHDGDRGPEVERIEQIPGPTDEAVPGGEDSPFEEAMLDFFLRPQDTLLPQARDLWPDFSPPKLVYKAPEFWNLAAHLLRKETGAEVAFLRIHELQSNTPGGVTENYARQWLDTSGRIVVAKLPGSALKRLLDRFPFPAVPMKEGPGEARYGTEVQLAGAGIDKKGRVSGVPITDSELYSVATTDDLLAKVEELPELTQAQAPEARKQKLGEFVIDALKARARGPQADKELREAMEGKTPFGPVWRLNLREASLQFANTQVGRNDSFGSVPDARIHSESQVVAQGTARLFSELYWGKLRWDAGISADYGKVTLKPKGAPSIVNVTTDRLSLETELRHRTRYIESGRFSLGPFAGLSYATQFSKPPGTPRAQAVTLKAGAKLFDGPRLKELYVAPLISKDYSLPQPHAQTGWSAGLRWDSVLPGTPVYLKGQVDYVEFFKETYDTPADLRRTLDATMKMSVPFYAGLRLSPFVSYYLFEGKLPDRTGFNILFGVSLEFSRLWKPLF